MRAEYINPFLESLDNVFTTMLDTAVRRDDLRLSDGLMIHGREGVTSMIGFSGKATGMVALCFPEATAIELTRKWLEQDIEEICDEVTDAVAELANMVAGSAKARFNLDPPPQLSLPTVFAGGSFDVRSPSRAACIELPFTSDAGRFSMYVSFEKALCPKS